MSVFTEEVVISNTPVPIEGGNATAIKTDGSAVTQPVSGTVGISGTVPVSGPLTDTQLRASPVPITGNVTVGIASSSTVTSITVTTVNITLLASNVNRKKAIIYNNTAKTLYVKLGTTASTISFSYLLTSGATLEVPNYTGNIDAILSAGSGPVLVTELV